MDFVSAHSLETTQQNHTKIFGSGHFPLNLLEAVMVLFQLRFPMSTALQKKFVTIFVTAAGSIYLFLCSYVREFDIHNTAHFTSLPITKDARKGVGEGLHSLHCREGHLAHVATVGEPKYCLFLLFVKQFCTQQMFL